MSKAPAPGNNSVDRTIDVFFYGLNMDAGILCSRGVMPRNPRVAYIGDHEVALSAKAMLLRARGKRAYGMLYQLTHQELDGLYANLADYRAEPFHAMLANGERVAALGMVHVDPPVKSVPEPGYTAAFHKLIDQLGLPAGLMNGALMENTIGTRPLQRYEGSCHCGAVRFAIETGFPELTTCDCSICSRKNALMVKVHETKFTLLAGEQSLTEYQFHTMTARHFFCKTCGIYPFHRKRITPDNVGINVFCLHDFDPAGIPVRKTVGAAMA